MNWLDLPEEERLQELKRRLENVKGKFTPVPWKWECCYQMEEDKFHWALVNPEQRDGGIGDNINRVINYKLVLLAHDDHPHTADENEFMDDDLRLVEVAPELLEAARAVVNKVMRAGFSKTCLDNTGIHEAIAKAEGGETS